MRKKQFIVVCFIFLFSIVSVFAQTQEFVKIRMQLIKVDRKAGWGFTLGSGGDVDGTGPMAEFQVVDPKRYSKKYIEIWLGGSKDLENAIAVLEKNIGKQYSLEVTKDFLESKYINPPEEKRRNLKLIEEGDAIKP